MTFVPRGHSAASVVDSRSNPRFRRSSRPSNCTIIRPLMPGSPVDRIYIKYRAQTDTGMDVRNLKRARGAAALR